jgi:two-component system, cell cycle sensor histidine kinase and response regulator CckA
MEETPLAGGVGDPSARTPAAKSDEALRRSEAQYRSLVEHSPDAIFVNHAERVILVNPACVRLFGAARAEELLGKSPFELFHPDDHEQIRGRIRRLRERGEPAPAVEERIVRLDGGVVEVEVSAAPFPFGEVPAIHVILRDVTQRKQMEAKFLQAQKLESIGRLAGGMAHDFNNLMTIIGGTAELAAADLPAGSALAGELAVIRDAVARGSDLTRHLLAFSRRQVLRPEIADLNRVLADLEPMLRRLIGADVELVVRLAPDLGAVRVDSGQMGQVLMNLAVNARDAMPQGGRLVVETANVELDEDYAEARPGVEPGPHVLLAVSDTGVGMDAATSAQVFEPFFTTKAPGVGTGLGLSTVYGIVRQSGGHIGVYSEPGHGTVFRIFLPRAAGTAVAARRPAISARAAAGSETILVVEDEEALRALVARALGGAGYRVHAAAGGAEALELLASLTEPVALVVTDLVMPGLSGPELVARLAASRPGVRFLYTSGYAPGASPHLDALGPGADFLGKPFTIAELSRKVREILDRPG